jgi:hypothetical protein
MNLDADAATTAVAALGRLRARGMLTSWLHARTERDLVEVHGRAISDAIDVAIERESEVEVEHEARHDGLRLSLRLRSVLPPAEWTGGGDGH